MVFLRTVRAIVRVDGIVISLCGDADVEEWTAFCIFSNVSGIRRLKFIEKGKRGIE